MYLSGNSTSASEQADQLTNALQADEDVETGAVTASTNSVNGKGAGKWLYVSHDPVPSIPTADQVLSFLGLDAVQDNPEAQEVFLKCEPMVLHITARTLEAASKLTAVAVQAGFRNTGLLVSSKGRVTVGIRPSPAGLNVPVLQRGQLLVSPAYLVQLLHIANEQMVVNFTRIQRLQKDVEAFLSAARGNDASWEPAEVRAARKRQEGLARKAAVQTQRHAPSIASATAGDGDGDDGLLGPTIL